MDIIDVAITDIFLTEILVLGLWSASKKKILYSNSFIAGRSLKWPVIGATLFASNISSIHIIGLAASGYYDGLVLGNFEWMVAFLLIVLGLIFSPFYFNNKVSTFLEFLEMRFGVFARSI